MNERTTKKRGVKEGTKNALKHANSRHSETQQVTYTPDEWEGVKADMAAAGVTSHTAYARRAVVNYRESQRVIQAAKELIKLSDTGLLNTINFEFNCKIIRSYEEKPA